MRSLHCAEWRLGSCLKQDIRWYGGRQAVTREDFGLLPAPREDFRWAPSGPLRYYVMNIVSPSPVRETPTSFLDSFLGNYWHLARELPYASHRCRLLVNSAVLFTCDWHPVYHPLN